MKTETLEQKVNSILSPVRILSVDEWFKISDVVHAHLANSTKEEKLKYWKAAEPINLIHHFESLTRGKWVEPVKIDESAEPWEIGIDVIRNTLERVWQPALLTKETIGNWFEIGEAYKHFTLHFHTHEIWFNTSSTPRIFHTVFDIIYQIDLFNRTASQKILVNYSENFIKELLK